MHFRKRLGTGFFGGEGFILQRITGPGVVFIEMAGDVREYDLAAGEVMRVDPGHIAMYEPSVDYDITTVKGVTNMLFSGEGLFLATLKGPGKVWLQSRSGGLRSDPEYASVYTYSVRQIDQSRSEMRHPVACIRTCPAVRGAGSGRRA